MPTLTKYSTPYEERTYAPRHNEGWHLVDQDVATRWASVTRHDYVHKVEDATPYAIFFYDLNDTESKFKTLKQRWLDETAYLSDPNAIYENPNYLEIIDLGASALPYIFEDLKQSNNDWFIALHKIIGINPIKDEHAGKFQLIKNDWLNWSKNYLGI